MTTLTGTIGSAARRPRRSGGRWRERGAALVLVSPFVIVFAVFQVFALLAALVLSFTNWKGASGGTFVGLANYAAMFRDPDLHLALWHTGLIWLLTVPVMSLGSLGCGYLLTGPLVWLRRTYRTLLFLPTLPALVVVGTLFLLLLDPSVGLVGRALQAVGVPPVSLRTDPFVAVPVIAATVVWRWFGYNMIIHLSALQNLPREVLESAQLDGAGRWRTFWHVVVPMSVPMIAFTTITSTIGIAGLFDEPYVIFGASGGPEQGGLVLGTYMFRQGFQYFNLGYASAITYVLTAVVLVFALVQLRMARRGN